MRQEQAHKRRHPPEGEAPVEDQPHGGDNKASKTAAALLRRVREVLAAQQAA